MQTSAVCVTAFNRGGNTSLEYLTVTTCASQSSVAHTEVTFVRGSPPILLPDLECLVGNFASNSARLAKK